MWQQFSERARKVVFYAQEEAQRFGEGYVSTEHLLLGLIKDPCTATKALDAMHVSCSRVKAEVINHLPRGDARPSQDMTLTPRAKRVIDMAYVEAKETLSDSFIGTEHLLLGMIREGDGLAGRVLAKLGVDLDMARAAVIMCRDKDPEVTKAKSAGAKTIQNPKRERTFLFEHIVLSMIANSDGIAAKAIAVQASHVGFLQWNLWRQVTHSWTGRPSMSTSEALDKVLQVAGQEAGDQLIQSQHVLLALVAIEDLPVGSVLRSAGLSYQGTKDYLQASG